MVSAYKGSRVCTKSKRLTKSISPLSVTPAELSALRIHCAYAAGACAASSTRDTTARQTILCRWTLENIAHFPPLSREVLLERIDRRLDRPHRLLLHKGNDVEVGDRSVVAGRGEPTRSYLNAGPNVQRAFDSILVRHGDAHAASRGIKPERRRIVRQRRQRIGTQPVQRRDQPLHRIGCDGCARFHPAVF